LLPPPPTADRRARALTALGLVVLAASAVFGADPWGVREAVLGSATPAARAAAVSRAAGADATAAGTATAAAAATTVAPASTVKPRATTLRSEPWWQGVATLSGTGATTTTPFTIGDDAIQWRLRYTCQSGHLTVGAPGRPRPLVDAACPTTATGYATAKGPTTLTVTADGPWQVQVDQQIDLPLQEPPLAAMTDPGATVAAGGDFYRIDQVGSGHAALYHLPDGTWALRFEDFYVTANTDLDIRLTPVAAPKTTDQFANAPQVVVAPLDVTAGSMNFAVPADIDPTQYKAAVIWCERVHSAYAAVTLSP
ncbi:MAG: DM13 domain-containing protein, partial [Acidimicrobiales bacterium]